MAKYNKKFPVIADTVLNDSKGVIVKIFLDTANVAEVKQLISTHLIDGITTNPSNISLEKNNIKEALLELCNLLKKGQVNIEVTEQEPEKVYKQAHEIAKLAPNVIVKIPCQGRYFSVIAQLLQEGIAINVTLVFSLIQALAVCKLGVQIISPFIGRIDDSAFDGSLLLYQLREMIDRYGFKTAILAASIRHVRHIHEAISSGADIITIPVSVFHKAFEHPLTELGVEKFSFDWKKMAISQFP